MCQGKSYCHSHKYSHSNEGNWQPVSQSLLLFSLVTQTVKKKKFLSVISVINI